LSVQHTDVGAYALGLLEAHDRHDFEQHLATCPECTAELAELSGLRELLADLDPVEPAADGPDQAQIADVVRRQSGTQRRRALVRRSLGLAAGAALLAGGVGIGIAAAHRPGPHVPPPPGLVVRQATNPGTGVTGKVELVPKAWGTAVTLNLSGIHGPLTCQLIAVSKTGQRTVVTGWFVPAAGYGVPGHPGHLIVQGGTAVQAPGLAAMVVTVVRGPTLVSISV